MFQLRTVLPKLTVVRFIATGRQYASYCHLTVCFCVAYHL